MDIKTKFNLGDSVVFTPYKKKTPVTRIIEQIHVTTSTWLGTSVQYNVRYTNRAGATMYEQKIEDDLSLS